MLGLYTVITGRIGSGKTTLLRVLLGLLPRDSGEIAWNGAPVEDPATFFVPPRSAYTAKVPLLFSESLRDNILLGQPESRVDLPAAVHRAVMEQDLGELEDGLDTLIGTKVHRSGEHRDCPLGEIQVSIWLLGLWQKPVLPTPRANTRRNKVEENCYGLRLIE